MVVTDARVYGCAARKDRGATVCPGTTVRRDVVDRRMLGALRETLLTPEAVAAYRRELEAMLRTDARPDHGKRLAEVERERDAARADLYETREGLRKLQKERDEADAALAREKVLHKWAVDKYGELFAELTKCHEERDEEVQRERAESRASPGPRRTVHQRGRAVGSRMAMLMALTSALGPPPRE
jgi:hypothetical protein